MSYRDTLRNIGVFAHVDAGKTTLTERMLWHSGAIRKGGSVDEGTAHTDNLPIERRRGISVRAQCAELRWKGTTIRLIDTPGHSDFSAEVERSMWALDGAVLVVSAAEGVQPQTERIWRCLSAQKIPIIFFINKTDRENADLKRVLRQIRKRLTPHAVPLSDPEALMEWLSERDDEAMERYLEGTLDAPETILPRVYLSAQQAESFPVLAGSALKDIGVEAVLDAVRDCLPAPEGEEDGPLCGVIFAVQQNQAMGREAHVRLFSGTLRNRDALDMPQKAALPGAPEKLVQRKVSQIRALSLDGQGRDLGLLRAGEIGAVYGLGNVRVGDVLGDPARLPREIRAGSYRAPLLTVRVEPETPDRMSALRAALEELGSEDISLDAEWSQHLQQLWIRVMGNIQLEVLHETIRDRFGIEVAFGPPSVVYRETITHAAEGFVAYTMPKPCWAILRFRIEPAPRGSGVSYRSIVPVRDIMLRYQHQVEQALPLALNQGMLGWQVDDIKITLIGGEHHLIHTHPLDFIMATPMGIMDGLRNGGSTLLEPILSTEIRVPSQCAGRVISDITTMRGELLSTENDGDDTILLADIPVSTSMQYPTALAALSGGKGEISMELTGYRECPMELGATAERRSVHPLDTSKYILAARSALDGGIWDA